MIKKHLFFIVFALCWSCTSFVYSANSVNGIRIWDSPEGTKIVFDLKNKTKFYAFSLEKPHRLVVDLNQARLKIHLPKIKSNHALIKKFRSAKRKNKDRRFVIETQGRLKYKVYTLKPNKRYGHRLVIQLKTKLNNRVTSKFKKPATRTKKLRDVIIAIDAGHGGEDPGASGYYGTKEKNINLTISKKLKRIIDKQAGMRAILVRRGDYYVSLRKRMSIAREAKADMFISIHADAFRNRKVKGSSVYVLSQGGATSEASKWLADQENAADLIGGVSLDIKDKTLAMVLLDLSQTATIDASTRVASNVLSEIRKIAPIHKPSVQNAGFVVLKSPDIPSILVETAFISNPKEEKRLLNTHYQNKLAQAILKGIKRYFVNSPPPNTFLASKLAKNTQSAYDRSGFLIERDFNNQLSQMTFQ